MFCSYNNTLYATKEHIEEIQKIKNSFMDISEIFINMTAYIKKHTNEHVKIIRLVYFDKDINEKIGGVFNYKTEKILFGVNLNIYGYVNTKINEQFESEVFGFNLFENNLFEKDKEIIKNNIKYYKVTLGTVFLEQNNIRNGSEFYLYADNVLLIDEYEKVNALYKKDKIKAKIYNIRAKFDKIKSNLNDKIDEIVKKELKKFLNKDKELNKLAKEISVIEEELKKKKYKYKQIKNKKEEEIRNTISINYNYRKNAIIPKLNIKQKGSKIIELKELSDLYEESEKLTNEYPELLLWKMF